MNRSTALRRFLWVVAVLLLALLAAGLWALVRADLAADAAALLGAPWGRVTVLDLYLGLAFVAAWIHAVERDARLTLAWALALCVLGNAATLAFLLWRGRRCATLGELFTGAPRP